MGLVGKVLGRVRRSSGPDPQLTRAYWEDMAGGSVEKAVQSICDGYDLRQFADSSGVHFDESELDASYVVLDLACGMGRTCRRVAGMVGEYHGVDFIPAMVAKARAHNRGVSNATFHVNDGRTLGRFADATFDVVYSELAFQHMPKNVQRSYAAEVERVLKDGGLFFAQLPRAEFYRGAEFALTEDEARGLLSPFASADLVRTNAYWLARAVSGDRLGGVGRHGKSESDSSS